MWAGLLRVAVRAATASALVAGALYLGGCLLDDPPEQDNWGAANSACSPGWPREIDHHGSGWNNGPYWEVLCNDGSVRVVPAFVR